MGNRWEDEIGKRSDFEKRPRDFYPTPLKAVEVLKGHLPDAFTFCEPCAGNGALVEHLEGLFSGALCVLPMDVEPQVEWIVEGDANSLSSQDLEHSQLIITNPPFTWSVLKPLMDKWISLRPTVLLLPADFLHNQRFAPYLKYCTKIVSIGRVKWIEDSKTAGVDNYVWAFFDQSNQAPTNFYGRI